MNNKITLKLLYTHFYKWNILEQCLWKIWKYLQTIGSSSSYWLKSLKTLALAGRYLYIQHVHVQIVSPDTQVHVLAFNYCICHTFHLRFMNFVNSVNLALIMNFMNLALSWMVTFTASIVFSYFCGRNV